MNCLMPDEFQLPLSQYLSTVQEVIQIAFNEPVWVKAEVRSLQLKWFLSLSVKAELSYLKISTF